MGLIDTYTKIEEKHAELTNQMSKQEILNDREKYLEITKKHADLETKVQLFQEYKNAISQKEDNESILSEESDPEMTELIHADLETLSKKIEDLEQKLHLLLVPKDPRDEKNVFVEIRAGSGGDESAIFAADLFRMYSRYAERKRWTIEITDYNDTGIGGYKEIIFMIKGKNVFSRMKFESGIHRVQRVPVTESQGRVHTSAATVAVLPEVDDTAVTINSEDIRIDVFRASGAGGQHVNKTESAVRITHIPSGLVVSCQDETSQHKNKDKAMKVLKARLFELEEAKRQEGISQDRKQQVGSGDRSGKIRTYNFPQNRITDHRIGVTLYKLDRFMDGDIEELLNALNENDNKEKLNSLSL